MMDLDSFLVSLYVLVDDWWQQNRSSSLPQKPGRPPLLSESEALTLAILAQWHRFRSERDFWRFAHSHLRGYFPALLSQSQFKVGACAPWSPRCGPCSRTWPKRSESLRRSTASWIRP